MSGAIRFPFRLTLNGQVATAPYGSDMEVNDAIAATMLTNIGERPLTPSFGVTDPAGQPINDVDITGDLQSALSTYGFEDVTIQDTTLTPEGNGLATVLVQWERDEPEVDPLEEEDDDE